MFSLPKAADPVLKLLAQSFGPKTSQRVLLLCVGAIITTGRRTVTHILATLGPLATGHFSSYHRVFSRAPWNHWRLAKILACLAIELLPPGEPILVLGDDTVAQHRGKNVFGKGMHRDTVRSSHSHIVWRFGHQWVVLAISVPLFFTSRRWALPVMVLLYLPKEEEEDELKEQDKAAQRRHKTPSLLARQAMAVLIRWFPDRRFILIGDSHYGTHELARFCHRHRRHVTLVSRFHSDANLYEPPPAYAGHGRPRVKGNKLPSPAAVVAGLAKGTRTKVRWYGGKSRKVDLRSGTGHWYKSGKGLVEVRWVHVHDREGTHRDEYFFSTDPKLTPRQLVSLYTDRWGIEVTFEEVRAHLGFETTRQWREKSVRRAAPCLLALYSIVTLIYVEHLRHHRPKPNCFDWYKKPEPTFSDAITTVRQLFWTETIFASIPPNKSIQKLSPRFRSLLLNWICPAA